MLVVQCNNGFHYEPMWYGVTECGRKWVVNFKEVLTGMIEIKTKKDPSASIFKKALKNWPIKFGKKLFSDCGIFPPEWVSCKCHEFELYPNWVLPTPKESRSIFTSPSLDGLLYCWNVEFPTEEVWRFFQPKPSHLKGALSDFLLGMRITSPFAEQKGVRRRLQKQFPTMGKMQLEEAIQRYGQRVLVKRGA